MDIPEHHRQIAKYVAGQFAGKPKVGVYHDDHGKRAVPIGEHGPATHRFYTTIGMCDEEFGLPEGVYEFATVGALAWLPDAIVSSVHWLKGRSFEEWPLVCEDAVRQNVKSTYWHMAYVPSPFTLQLGDGRRVRWLLGTPITDAQRGLGVGELEGTVREAFPAWLFQADDA